MIRISTIFIAVCMVLVAASLGLILYSMAGISGSFKHGRGVAALLFSNSVLRPKPTYTGCR